MRRMEKWTCLNYFYTSMYSTFQLHRCSRQRNVFPGPPGTDVLKFHLIKARFPLDELVRAIAQREAKQEFSNVIVWRKSSLICQPITLLNPCLHFASREQINSPSGKPASVGNDPNFTCFFRTLTTSSSSIITA